MLLFVVCLFFFITPFGRTLLLLVWDTLKAISSWLVRTGLAFLIAAVIIRLGIGKGKQ